MKGARLDLGCTKCRLSETRTQVVPGTGDHAAALVFIGEAPGRDEDLKGAPFVGRAGKVLDSALSSAGVSREMVYITNLVKCRPPGNRRPRTDEAEACQAQLDAELSGGHPVVVCLLGQTVARHMLGDRSKMKEMVGRERNATIGGREVRVFVAYHPASCLYTRENVESLKETVELCAKAAGLP